MTTSKKNRRDGWEKVTYEEWIRWAHKWRVTKKTGNRLYHAKDCHCHVPQPKRNKNASKI